MVSYKIPPTALVVCFLGYRSIILEYISGVEAIKIVEGIPSLRSIERISVFLYIASALVIAIASSGQFVSFVVSSVLLCADYWVLKMSSMWIFGKRKNVVFIILNFVRYLIIAIVIAILFLVIKIDWLGFLIGMVVGPVFLVLATVGCIVYEKLFTKSETK